MAGDEAVHGAVAYDLVPAEVEEALA